MLEEISKLLDSTKVDRKYAIEKYKKSLEALEAKITVENLRSYNSSITALKTHLAYEIKYLRLLEPKLVVFSKRQKPELRKLKGL